MTAAQFNECHTEMAGELEPVLVSVPDEAANEEVDPADAQALLATELILGALPPVPLGHAQRSEVGQPLAWEQVKFLLKPGNISVDASGSPHAAHILGVAVRAVATRVPEAMEAPPVNRNVMDKNKYWAKDVAEKFTTGFLHGNVEFLHGTELIRRSNLLDPKIAIDELARILAAQNHPSIQIVRKLVDLFPAMTENDQIDFQRKVLICTMSGLIRRVYTNLITERRER